MRFHRVVIKNIKGLVGTYELDLDKVFDGSGIFLLHGSNGTGKTTIFESICLALFGKTPSFEGGHKNEEDPFSKAHLLNNTQVSGSVSLIFSIENIPQRDTLNSPFTPQKDSGPLSEQRRRRRYFMASWSIRRARLARDEKGVRSPLSKDLQAPYRSLLELDEDFRPERVLFAGTKVKVIDFQMEQILHGLTFKDFTQTVLLPQGKFAEFIDASNAKERIQILENITATERYEVLGQRIEQRAVSYRDQLKALDAELKGYPSLDEFRVAASDLEKNNLKVAYYQQLNACAEEWKSLIGINGLKDQQKQLWETVEQEKASFKLQQEQVLVQRSEQERLTQSLVEARAAEVQLEERRGRLQSFEEQRDAVAELLKEHQHNLQREEDRATITNRELKRLPEGLSQEQALLEQLQGVARAEKRALLQLLPLGEQGEEAVDEDWIYLAVQNRQRGLNEQEQGLIEHREVLQMWSNALCKRRLYRSTVESIEAQIKGERLEKKRKELELKSLKETLEGLSTRHQELSIEHKFIHLRIELTPGASCMVCGSKEHPLLEGQRVVGLPHGQTEAEQAVERLQEELRCVEEEKKRAEARIEQLNKESCVLGNKISENRGRISNSREFIAKEEEVIELKGSWLQLNGPAEFSITSLEQELRQHLHEERVENNHVAVASLSIGQFIEHRLERLTLLKQQLNQQAQNHQEAQANLSRAKVTLGQKVGQLERRQELLNLQKRQQLQLEQLRVELREHRELLKAIYATFLSAESSFQTEEVVINQWLILAEQAFRDLKEQSDRAKMKSEIQLQSKAAELERLSKSSMQLSDRLTVAEQKIQLLRQKSIEVHDIIERKEAQLLEQTRPLYSGPVQVLQADLEPIEAGELLIEQQPHFARELGRLEAELVQSEEVIAKYKTSIELQERREQYRIESGYWTRLKKVVTPSRGRTFRAFVQAVQLGQLVTNANAQLKELSSNLRLEISKDEQGFAKLDFSVSKGSEPPRPLTSLSGGETFIVALSLALSVADLRATRMPIETLLIDEGFGTLDHNNVEQVVNCLSTLHMRNIQVGLISHVQSLIDSLETKIDVMTLVVDEGQSRSPSIETVGDLNRLIKSCQIPDLSSETEKQALAFEQLQKEQKAASDKAAEQLAEAEKASKGEAAEEEIEG